MNCKRAGIKCIVTTNFFLHIQLVRVLFCINFWWRKKGTFIPAFLGCFIIPYFSTFLSACTRLDVESVQGGYPKPVALFLQPNLISIIKIP
jgi:hypothetical protein